MSFKVEKLLCYKLGGCFLRLKIACSCLMSLTTFTRLRVWQAVTQRISEIFQTLRAILVLCIFFFFHYHFGHYARESQYLKPFGIFSCSQRKQYLIQSLFWVLDSIIGYYFQLISMGRKLQISYALLEILLSYRN